MLRLFVHIYKEFIKKKRKITVQWQKKRLRVLFPLSEEFLSTAFPVFPWKSAGSQQLSLELKFSLDVFWSRCHVLGEGRIILPKNPQNFYAKLHFPCDFLPYHQIKTDF